jgi:hypothetical protein
VLGTLNAELTKMVDKSEEIRRCLAIRNSICLLEKNVPKLLRRGSASATQLEKMDCTAAVTKAPNRHFVVNSITK